MTAIPLFETPFLIGAPQHGRYHVECVTTDEAVARLGLEWDALHARIRDAHPSTSSAWVFAWRNYVASRSGVLRGVVELYTVRNTEGELIAVVPTVRHDLRVAGISLARWLRVGIASEYTEETRLLVAPENEQMVVRLLSARISALEYEVVFWTGLQPGGPAMTGLLAKDGAREEPSFSTLTVRLPRTWEALYAGLSKKMRQNLRRNYKALASRNHEFAFRVVQEASEVSVALDAFFALHMRPTERHRATPQFRRFVNAHTRAFLRTMVEGLARRDIVRIYALSVGDQTVAMRLGFVYRGGIYLYLFVDDARWRTFGVLTILVTEILKHAILSGHQFVYLSTGRRLSNLRWRPEETRSGQVAVWQVTSRARMLRMARVARRHVTLGVIAFVNAFCGTPPRGRPPVQRGDAAPA